MKHNVKYFLTAQCHQLCSNVFASAIKARQNWWGTKNCNECVWKMWFNSITGCLSTLVLS